MKKLVKESVDKPEQGLGMSSIADLLKPKTQEEVTLEIKRRLKGRENDMTVIKETPKFVLYKIEKADLIKDIIHSFSGREEDVFFNFYLILDNSVTGFRQIIGVKVSPDGQINAMDAKGSKIETEYLEKFS